jgi:predicted AlkP superfamily pyrophosphatase or phosphodiesterase
MIKNEFLSRLFLILSVLAISACSQYGKVVNSQVQLNSKDTLNKPYVLLISLDGFRWDYVDRFKPPHLSQFIKNGVQAESLIPAFPTKTFPNHYSIATGMYPDKHNILGNSFYDYKKQATYSTNNRETVEDGSFYAGTPIWVQAALSGMVTSSYFFVGTEAKIQGYRPSNYYNFDSKVTHETRINQALDWLALPAEKRPHLITLYFSDMDNTGHDFGPNNNQELNKALFKLDNTLGDLFKGIEDSGLPVNTIIVSDHGMAEIKTDNLIPVELIKNNEIYLAIENGSLINIHPKNFDQTDAIFDSLKDKAKNNHFKIYKTENTPGFEYIPQNKNWGSIQLVSDNGYYFSKTKNIERKIKKGNDISGHHGFNPINKEMHGIFYASGPAFNKGQTIPSFKNIHIYPVMCKILGLQIPDNIDGKLEVLEKVLEQK